MSKPISEMTGKELYKWVAWSPCEHSWRPEGPYGPAGFRCADCRNARLVEIRDMVPQIGTCESNVNAIALGQLTEELLGEVRRRVNEMLDTMLEKP